MMQLLKLGVIAAFSAFPVIGLPVASSNDLTTSADGSSCVSSNWDWVLPQWWSTSTCQNKFDKGCLCNDGRFIEDVAQAIYKRCPTAEVAPGLLFLKQLCLALNVTILEVPPGPLSRRGDVALEGIRVTEGPNSGLGTFSKDGDASNRYCVICLYNHIRSICCFVPGKTSDGGDGDPRTEKAVPGLENPETRDLDRRVGEAEGGAEAESSQTGLATRDTGDHKGVSDKTCWQCTLRSVAILWCFGEGPKYVKGESHSETEHVQREVTLPADSDGRCHPCARRGTLDKHCYVATKRFAGRTEVEEGCFKCHVDGASSKCCCGDIFTREWDGAAAASGGRVPTTFVFDLA